MKTRSIKSISMAAVAALFLSTSVYAAPNGKPFVEINGQLVAIEGVITDIKDQVELVTDRVASLEEKTETLEGRATILDSTITALQVADVALGSLIAANTTSIDALTLRVIQLEADVVQLRLDTSANTAAIAALEEEIISINTAIATVDTDSINGDADLQSQIDSHATLISNMQIEIDAIKEDIKMKQDIISQTCPDGEVVVGFTANSLSCAPEGGGTQGISTYKVSAFSEPDENGYVHLPAYCNTGDFVTGGGYSEHFTSYHVNQNHPILSNTGWLVSGTTSRSLHTLWCSAVCLKVTP